MTEKESLVGKVEKEQETDLKELVKPVLNRIFVQVLMGDKEWVPGIEKTETSMTPKPYVRVISVGEGVRSTKAGDYALTREGALQWSMSLWDNQYTVLNETDLQLILDPIVVREMETAAKKAKGKSDIVIVN